MGLLDKIKNALFEVEYVEVEDTPKKEKEKDKPIAKKVVLPGKKEQKIEELHEEELRDEDFEIRPRDEAKKEEEDEPRDDFKYMDDDDFKVDKDDYVEDIPKILRVVDNDTDEVLEEEEPPRAYPEREEKTIDYYSNMYAAPPRESKPYGMDRSYNVPVHEYGTYEKKEEKTGFRPSPIISPIYGILDKNYRKEDVKEKRNIQLTSSYSRSGVSVDEIRNKAYGDNKKIERASEDHQFEVEEAEEENVMVDLNDKAKPEVKEITMGDALEYFQDLGLEYNVDYVDASKEKAAPKKEVVKEEPKHEEVVEEPKHEEVVEEVKEEVVEELPKEEEVKEEKAPEKKNDKESVDDDNLFDLIDSMYQENE